MVTRTGIGLAILAGLVALGQVQVSDAHRLAPTPEPIGRSAGEAEDQSETKRVWGPKFDPDLFEQVHAFTVPDPLAETGDAAGSEDRYVEVSRGDTLIGILTQNGVDRREAHAAVTELSSVFDVRRLQIGQGLTLTFETGAGDDRFVGLALQPDPERDVRVMFDDSEGDGQFVAAEEKRALSGRDRYAAATIDSSLYEAATQAGMPVDVLMDMIRVFSFDVDFQRDIQVGDKFEVLFEQMQDEFGVPVRNGDIQYAAMTLSGKTVAYYRFTPGSGFTDYFDATGQSVRKTLMRTPVNGARLSSGFGKRKHPILGYTKMHKGVDFAAPRGTPIMAAGDGVIERAGRNGGYGNYVRLRHNSEIKTAYAHLHKFARGIKVGTRVRQGDIIAYVGSTGRSTGPHLHYEVLKNGRQVNPLSVKLPAGEKLKGKDLKKLQAAVNKLDIRVADARTGTAIATAVDE